MFLAFEKLPKFEKLYLIERFGLSDTEEDALRMRYVDGFTYHRIAAELHMSEKSVGNTLTRARRHMVEIAKQLYPIADDRTRHLIDVLGWVELDFPTLANRRKL